MHTLSVILIRPTLHTPWPRILLGGMVCRCCLLYVYIGGGKEAPDAEVPHYVRHAHSRTPNKYDVICQSFKVNLIYQSSAFRIKMSYLKVFDLLHCFMALVTSLRRFICFSFNLCSLLVVSLYIFHYINQLLGDGQSRWVSNGCPFLCSDGGRFYHDASFGLGDGENGR